MTAPAVPLADRSMRARRTSKCHICRGLVTVGQRIARVTVDGRPRWPHVACLVAARPVETVNLPPFGGDAA